MFLVRLDDVSLAFGPRKLLRGAELSIEPAERVCLVGRNGAGKTPVLRLVTGARDPDEGEVRRHGDLCILNWSRYCRVMRIKEWAILWLKAWPTSSDDGPVS